LIRVLGFSASLAAECFSVRKIVWGTVWDGVIRLPSTRAKDAYNTPFYTLPPKALRFLVKRLSKDCRARLTLT
jgi:hypothetical protein